MNQIMTIHPYKFEGQWVFDDASKGLDKEPFVSGADDILDHITQIIPGAEKGVTILFSSKPFPGVLYGLTRAEEEQGGWWYEMGDMRGWLCPALFKYFDKAPDEIWIGVKKKESR